MSDDLRTLSALEVAEVRAACACAHQEDIDGDFTVMLSQGLIRRFCEVNGLDAPTWQAEASARHAFERGVNAMRDVAVLVIEARHESGHSCDPWKLVEAIRAAAPPTNPYGVREGVND